jgi:hypothetical protein
VSGLCGRSIERERQRQRETECMHVWAGERRGEEGEVRMNGREGKGIRI